MKDRNLILCPSCGADVKDIRPYDGKCLIREQARLDPDLTGSGEEPRRQFTKC